MVKKLERVFVSTRFGRFCLEISEKGLYRLYFPGRFVPGSAAKKNPHPAAVRLIRQYLEGKPVSFKKLPLDLAGFTLFERKVLRALATVSRGRSISYQALAANAGNRLASRAVGMVMKKNRLPIILPCHRVLRSDGSLGGFSQGLGWKKRLLFLEARQ